jgi:hypothetical protein
MPQGPKNDQSAMIRKNGDSGCSDHSLLYLEIQSTVQYNNDNHRTNNDNHRTNTQIISRKHGWL